MTPTPTDYAKPNWRTAMKNQAMDCSSILGGERTTCKQSELEVLVDRLVARLNQAEHVESELLSLIARLKGPSPCANGEARLTDGGGGQLGRASATIDDMEHTLGNCQEALLQLRSVV